MAANKVYILCRFARQSGVYRSWLDRLEVPFEVVHDFAGDWVPPPDAGLLVTHMHYRWEEVRALRRVMESGQVPVLILADGILEYRNTFEHPELADGAVFQPIVGHKLACLGAAQARVVESWGNVGKCEIVGLPRLDSLLEQPLKPVNRSGLFRLLIATANTPAFDESQRLAVIESLSLIRQRFQQNAWVDRRPVEVTWRLTDGLDRELGLELRDEGVEPPGISETIDTHDAVIVTPSTMFLESLLKGRPTALLDFHNTPHFVPSAWMINAPKHLNSTLQELASPPEPKMLFQRMVLHDQLECHTPAAPRLFRLIDEMIACGIRCRSEGIPLAFPHRILENETLGFGRVDRDYDLSRLFPKNRYFQQPEIAFLTAELNLAISRLAGMPEENARVMQNVEAQKEQCDWLNARNRELLARNLMLRERWRKLKSELQSLPAELEPDPESGGDDPPGDPKPGGHG